MKKIKSTKGSITVDPSNIIAYSRQGLYIFVTVTGGVQHNISCVTEQEAVNTEAALDAAFPTPPVTVTIKA